MGEFAVPKRGSSRPVTWAGGTDNGVVRGAAEFALQREADGVRGCHSFT